MEQVTSEETLVSLESLSSMLPQEIAGIKGIIGVAETHLGKSKIPAVKQAYAGYCVGLILDLIRGLDDQEVAKKRLVDQGITGIRIGDQTVRIADPKEGQNEIILTK